MEQRVIASTKAGQNRMIHESGIETSLTLKEIKSKKEDANNIQCRKKFACFGAKFDWGVTTL